MFETSLYSGNREEDYQLVCDQLGHIVEGEQDWIANLANASALLGQYLQEINWVGFYLWKEDQLVLGPFQGWPACVRIALGKGVCGTAVAQRATQLVADVHAFPGHIACDARSRSEIVIPMFDAAGEIIGVLDIDSPKLARFDETDKRWLERFVQVLCKVETQATA